MTLITTDRLVLREFDLEDASFILELVNDQGWLENIGDKNVHSIEDAEQYLLSGPIRSYQENGYGLYMVELKLTNIAVGMCGLVKRDCFKSPDVGFAFVPEYRGLGFASEAGRSVLKYAKSQLSLNRVIGVTSMNNVGSMKALEKMGMQYDSLVSMPGYDEKSRLFVPR